MIDVRFLPNPFYDPEMRTLTGRDEKVSAFLSWAIPRPKGSWTPGSACSDAVMPGYVAEGKSHLSIAVGCTGGQHRSVAIAEATASYLEKSGYRVSISHRDLANWPQARRTSPAVGVVQGGAESSKTSFPAEVRDERGARRSRAATWRRSRPSRASAAR